MVTILLCSPAALVGTRLHKFNPLHDNIVLAQATFANFGAVQNDMTQVGANTVITDPQNPANAITLTGVKASSLHASDFHFV